MYARSPKELALLVADRRKRLNLSQAEVGDLVGLKQKTISAFENKPMGTQLETLFRILAAVNLDIKLVARDEIKTQWKEEW